MITHHMFSIFQSTTLKKASPPAISAAGIMQVDAFHPNDTGLIVL